MGLVHVAFAQNNVVLSAYNYYKEQSPEKAKEFIDKAIQNEESASEAKTWFYRGNIYLQVNSVAHMTDGLVKGITAENIKQRLGEPVSMRNYNKLENGEKWIYSFGLIVYLSNSIMDSYEYPNEALYRSLDNGNTLDVAYESYQKSIAIDPKFVNVQISPMNALTGLEAVSGSYYNSGINAYSAKHFAEAQKNLESALKTSEALGKQDAELNYYTGIAAMSAGDTTKSIQYYEKSTSLGYKDKLLYYNLVNIYLNKNMIKEAKVAIRKGREINPADQDLLIMEANIYLKTGEAKEAEQILLKAIENDPTNANLYYVIGANYDNILNDTVSSKTKKDNAFLQAQQSYVKAIELNKDYFDANFNMGVLLNNKAAEILVLAANLPLAEDKKYEEMKNEAIEYLKKAQPFLERALELQPNDKDCLVLLKQIYLKTNNTEKFKFISDLLKENK